MAPKVSIIIPVYKTPVALLNRCLESALGQVGVAVEVIAVDDFSPDACPDVLDNFAAKDNRVTVIHRSINGRAGMARNDGIERARGDFIVFIDADDFMQPDMCETLMNHALKTDTDIVACSWSVIDQDGHCALKYILPYQYYDLNSNQQRAKAYRRMNYALWNKLFKFEIISSLKFEQFEANIGEDLLFNIAALCRSRSMATIPYCGYNYTLTETSATGRTSKGLPYLQTLAQSSGRIKQTILSSDKSDVGRKFSDRMALKRFTTGCGWIAEHPDPDKRNILWEYWCRHLKEDLLPELEFYKILSLWYMLFTSIFNAPVAYRFLWYLNRLSDPLTIANRIKDS